MHNTNIITTELFMARENFGAIWHQNFKVLASHDSQTKQLALED